MGDHRHRRPALPPRRHRQPPVSARLPRRLGLAARIDHREYAVLGCDLATWLNEGLLDYLVIGQRTLGGYTFDLAPFVKLACAARTDCAVLFGEEGIVSGHDRTAAEDKLIAAGKMAAPESASLSLEHHQTRAACGYAAGADGIHLFNENNRGVMQTLGTVPAATPSSPRKPNPHAPAPAGAPPRAGRDVPPSHPDRPAPREASPIMPDVVPA